MRYQPSTIEPKWQQAWDQAKLFETPRDVNELKKKPKFYALDMFPYPSGAGLHVGHPEGYTATDIVARFKRMNGFHVLHTMGWDAFGLPAERASMREGQHPAVITKRNIDNFRGQIKRLGFFLDWSREISTTDEDYYKWTQWIFLKLYERDLAYLAEVNVNWCPALKTVLANEEVKDGRYVETGDIVEKRLMRQWMLKITAYAERLLTDLEGLDWPENVKEMQRNWIGKSEGARITFAIENTSEKIEVFTTRPDTIFGVSFLVLAPEHALAPTLLSASKKKAGLAFIEEAGNVSEAKRTDASKDKTGFFTGAYATHPFTGQHLPIFLADYVLAGYGTGAIMGVPSDDERDRQFAEKYKLPVVEIYQNSGNLAVLQNSQFLDGMTQKEASAQVIAELVKTGAGVKETNYKLRDWLFSRQRYWGEPFPIVYTADGQPHPLAAGDLPISLPAIDEYRPTDDGQPPLARAPKSWREVKLPSGEVALREVNTMPQWAGSCWYYLRYLDPQNVDAPFSKDLEQYWMPVDLYIGGIEHAVLHLLYARFWHKVLFDCGLVHTVEPFQKLFNQGMILAPSFQDKAGKYYYPEEVYQKDNKSFTKVGDIELHSQIEKMSKSRNNVVNPDLVIDQYGADAMRLYEMFMGPLEQVKPWQMAGVEGVHRFLNRVWRLVVNDVSGEESPLLLDDEKENKVVTKALHQTIKKITTDIEELKFNTAIAQMMTFVNEVMQAQGLTKSQLKIFLKILSPFAPHLSDELWERLGEKSFLLNEPWPQFDASLLVDNEVELVVQVAGKKRGSLRVAKDLSQEEITKLALNDAEIGKFLQGQQVVRVVVVPNRIVNIVVKPNE
jgi:leucyl-tRNA synthetase